MLSSIRQWLPLCVIAFLLYGVRPSFSHLFYTSKKCLYFIKDKLSCFWCSLVLFLFVLLVFHKFLETKIGVLHWTLNLVFVAVLLISVNCEHPDYCFCLHHFVIQKKNMKLTHQLNYENCKTYFIGFRWRCWSLPSEICSVRWTHCSVR